MNYNSDKIIKKKKVLVVGMNIRAFSPTYNRWCYALKQEYEVNFFGPGFVSDREVESGLKEWYINNGPFDFVFISTHFIWHGMLEKECGYQTAYNNIFNSYVYQFDTSIAVKNINLIVDEFCDISVNKILVYDIDTISLKDYTAKKISEMICADNCFLLGPGKQFTNYRSEYKHVEKESFYNTTTDYWKEIVDKFDDKIISMPFHTLADTDFKFNEISKRKYDWSIIGTSYDVRKIARNELKKNGINCVENKHIRRIYSGLSLAKVKIGRISLLGSLFNETFKFALENSKYSYTCGSRYKEFVLKYLEIPASGAVLVCYPFDGIEDAGFINGVNAIICEPEEIVRIHEFLKNNPNKAQEIAKQGQKMVWEKYRIASKGKQIKLALEAIEQNRFNGGYWDKGEFKIRSKK